MFIFNINNSLYKFSYYTKNKHKEINDVQKKKKTVLDSGQINSNFFSSIFIFVN